MEENWSGKHTLLIGVIIGGAAFLIWSNHQRHKKSAGGWSAPKRGKLKNGNANNQSGCSGGLQAPPNIPAATNSCSGTNGPVLMNSNNGACCSLVNSCSGQNVNGYRSPWPNVMNANFYGNKYR